MHQKANEPTVVVFDFNPDPTLLLMEDANRETSPKLHALNRVLVQLIEEFNMVSFIPLNIQDEDSVDLVLSHIDSTGRMWTRRSPRTWTRAMRMRASLTTWSSLAVIVGAFFSNCD
ncbi:hypothetical protein BJ741DRAFT_715073 [Chytriomyces cf. hyalinus JEL632]|nr:hypothetical protein BJ741DRAFT_715073 [Chytriomyces cf. hyalinus JEL632]